MAQEQRAEQRREDILSAALAVFADKGYHAAGVADIAGRLGIGHGTFYRYFRSKRDIFDALVIGITTEISAVVSREPPETDSLEAYRAQLYRIAGRLFHIFAEDPRLARIMLFEAPGVDARLQQQFQTAMTLYAQFTAQYLENGIDKGFLRPDMDIVIVSRAVNAVIFEGIRDIAFSREPEKDAQRWIDQGVALMLQGVGRPAGK